MWVVKLGGSLARSPELVKWLGVFYKLRRKINFVIIPGGGIFADHIYRKKNPVPIIGGVPSPARPC